MKPTTGTILNIRKKLPLFPFTAIEESVGITASSDALLNLELVLLVDSVTKLFRESSVMLSDVFKSDRRGDDCIANRPIFLSTMNYI